jgi:hypothetical protein
MTIIAPREIVRPRFGRTEYADRLIESALRTCNGLGERSPRIASSISSPNAETAGGTRGPPATRVPLPDLRLSYSAIPEQAFGPDCATNSCAIRADRPRSTDDPRPYHRGGRLVRIGHPAPDTDRTKRAKPRALGRSEPGRRGTARDEFRAGTARMRDQWTVFVANSGHHRVPAGAIAASDVRSMPLSRFMTRSRRAPQPGETCGAGDTRPPSPRRVRTARAAART